MGGLAGGVPFTDGPAAIDVGFPGDFPDAGHVDLAGGSAVGRENLALDGHSALDQARDMGGAKAPEDAESAVGSLNDLWDSA